jgi:hypothetical protein
MEKAVKEKKGSVVNDMLNMCVIYASDFVERMNAASTQSKKAELLNKVGFVNTIESVKYKEMSALFKRAEGFYKILNPIIEGNSQAFFVPAQGFLEVLKKYDLVCGTFKQYKGDVPLENLEIINDIQDKYIRNYYRYDFYGLDYRTDMVSEIRPHISLSSRCSSADRDYLESYFVDKDYCELDIMKDLNRFPFLGMIDDFDDDAIERKIRTHLFKKTANVFQRIFNISSFFEKNATIRTTTMTETKDNLFICAPRVDMVPNIIEVKANVELEVVKDPLIVSLVKTNDIKGVVVHTGWGMEINTDEMTRMKDATGNFMRTFKDFEKRFCIK